MRALGLMSGTSLDGVDAALIETDGTTVTARIRSAFFRYSQAEQASLRAVLGHWPGPGLEAAETIVMARHAQAIAAFPEAEIIGFHGQTLAHDPAGFRTHQLGDGAALATRVPVVWDFRTADVLSGGEGAPLVPVYHFACALALGLATPAAFLNLGGVGNVTWLDPRKHTPEALGALLAFDTGPGNALMNDVMTARFGQSHDADGRLAAEGRVDDAVLAEVMAHPFFLRKPPKSLDRDSFTHLLNQVAPLSSEDALATLAAITAASVAAAIRHMPEPPDRWLVAGGGRHNCTVMRQLAERTNAPVDPVEEVNLDGDMLEAEAFAFLAVRVARGLATSFPGTTACRVPVCGGRISQPS